MLTCRRVAHVSLTLHEIIIIIKIFGTSFRTNNQSHVFKIFFQFKHKEFPNNGDRRGDHDGA